MYISDMEVQHHAEYSSSSDLRNHYNEISVFATPIRSRVFITKNGTGDLVVLSNAEYERLAGLEDLRQKLMQGLEASRAGRTRNAEEVFAHLERKFGFDAI